MSIKARHAFQQRGRDEGEMFSQEGKVYSKEGDMPSESSHEGEVAKKGENQRGNHGFRGRPSHHWMMVTIQASVSGFN